MLIHYSLAKHQVPKNGSRVVRVAELLRLQVLSQEVEETADT
jgi:hypothetical protein